MGSMWGGGVVGVWVGRDRLRPTHLRATLTRLRDKERREWQPCTLHGQEEREGEEVGIAGRDGAVEWQGQACGALGWGFETKFGAAAILDRLLVRVRIPPRYLHAVAAAAVFLSAKINEEDENVPSTEEVVWRGGMRCSARELLRMERVLLDKLAWCLPSTTVLDFLQVLHALAIVTAPKHLHQQCRQRLALRGEGSPTHQLEGLTERLWQAVGCGGSGGVRPSLLALALLSLELDAATPEPGLTLWLQALTQVSEEELIDAQVKVRGFLSDSFPCLLPTPPPPSSPPPAVPPSRPNKRKVERSVALEEEAYMDIKKLYAHSKTHPSTSTQTTRALQDEPDDLYADIHRLYSSPIPLNPPSPTPTTPADPTFPSSSTPTLPSAVLPHASVHPTSPSNTPLPHDLTQATCPSPTLPDASLPQDPAQPTSPSNPAHPTPPPIATAVPAPKRSTSAKKRKRRRKKVAPTFKAKTAVKSCLKQALKIPCKISLIATKKIFEEPLEEDEGTMDVEEEEEEEEMMEELEEEEEEEVVVEEGEEYQEGPLLEPVSLLNSPIFSPMSPEFPDIKHLVVKKEDMCWDQQVRAVAEQVYRPLTYAQVLRLHLTPLTRALGV